MKIEIDGKVLIETVVERVKVLLKLAKNNQKKTGTHLFILPLPDNYLSQSYSKLRVSASNNA
ncbi:MAG: hypothetical protein ACYSR0_08425 [Planctomycetota bacterium]|jgi:hypothetical protein